MRTRLRITLITCLLFATFTLNAESLLSFNGHGWIKLSSTSKNDYASGYLVATWTLTEVILKAGSIEQGEAYAIVERAISMRSLNTLQIVQRIDEYYRRRSLDTPLWMVLYDLREPTPSRRNYNDPNPDTDTN